MAKFTNRNEAVNVLLSTAQKTIDSTFHNYLLSEVKAGTVLEGYNEDKRRRNFSLPILAASSQVRAGAPPQITFSLDRSKNAQKDGRAIKMQCEFKTAPSIGATDPLTMVNFAVYLVIKENQNDEGIRKKMKTSYQKGDSRSASQSVSATFYLTLEEFVYLKERLANRGAIGFSWSAEVPYYKVRNATDVERIRTGKDFNRHASVYKTIGLLDDFVISQDSKAAYGGVKNLLCWEHETAESKYTVWYKDTMQEDTFDFLPQEYRIKADPGYNEPLVTMGVVADSPSDYESYKITIGMEVGPFFHPQAKRDLFKIISRRSKGKMNFCNLNYGGYESSRFEWNRVGEINLNGSQIKISEGAEEIETEPDSSFFLSFETSIYGLGRINSYLTKEALQIGTVYLTVQEGLEGRTRDIPIPVNLDLHFLTGIQVGAEFLPSENKKIKFPYQIELSNFGNYDLTIGGCEISAYSEKKGKERDAMHNLKTMTRWSDFTLKADEKKIIEFTPTSIQRLNKKDTVLFLFHKNYWTEFVCEPFDVSLKTEDSFESLLTRKLDTNLEYDLWKLRVYTDLRWEEFPGLLGVQVEMNNEELFIEKIIELSREKDSIDVFPTDTVKALVAARDDMSRKLRFRLRVRTADQQDSDWSDWKETKEGESMFLFISTEDIKPLIH